MSSKVGIVTIQDISNYGNRLQNVATSMVLDEMGFESESLIFEGQSTVGKARSIAKNILGQQDASNGFIISDERIEAFERFNSLITFQHIARKCAKDINSYYEYFCVGSDQIWRMSRFGIDENINFLQFADPNKRVALAPSFGVDCLSRIQGMRLKKYLNGYIGLSVREESGAQLIKQSTGYDATVLCDPTLAVSVDKWRELSDSRLNPDEPYIFVYLLGNESKEYRGVIDQLVIQGLNRIVLLTSQDLPGELPAGPAEFLSLIDNASHVVTDSFHATVFSALFETPLTIVHRDGGGSAYSKMFSRLSNLATKIGLLDKIAGTSSFSMRNASHFDGVSERIGEEGNRYHKFAERIMNA